ncbi:hypothetical protein T484DRAFT_1841685 [Baffinella frigidus]|nr:hypothetical protein T484DRAFT_1841685 [Cryptophyta sp. CCMP2293]
MVLRGAGLGGEVKDASFFYLDRIVLAAVEKEVLLFSYALPDTSRAGGSTHNDIERLKARGSFRRVGALQGAAERVTAMAGVNSFLSHLVLIAGSNRHVEGGGVVDIV